MFPPPSLPGGERGVGGGIVGAAPQSSEPSFVGHVQNVTVAVGRDADLDCQVRNIGRRKVRRECNGN